LRAKTFVGVSLDPEAPLDNYFYGEGLKADWSLLLKALLDM